jgi:phosphopantothenoylcysteine decarboxylase / phosphopantothenate---cysteine ligase
VKFLITAGPTREPIDPVRYISNRSSGKMGYAIAQAALDAGHEVILVSGPVCLKPPSGARIVRVTTSDEMYDAVHARLDGIDIAVMCAAVADFKPANCAAQKIKKNHGLEKILLTPTRDILSSLGKLQKKFLLVGFAAETNSPATNARKKLREKKCDIVIGNDVSRMDAGFESDDNELTLFYKSGEKFFLPREKKTRLAKKLVKIFKKLQEKS